MEPISGWENYLTRGPDDGRDDPPMGTCGGCKRRKPLHRVSGEERCIECATGVYRCACCSQWQVETLGELCGQCSAEQADNMAADDWRDE